MRIPYMALQRDKYWRKIVIGIGIWKTGTGCIQWREILRF